MAQWLPLPTQNDEESRSLVQSVLEVFPYVTLWTTELHEMLIIGSLQPIVLDAARITERFNKPKVSATLAEVGIGSPAALLATYITDRAGLKRYAGDAGPVTDDDPRIEYANWVRKGEFSRVLFRLLDMRGDPPLTGDQTIEAAVKREGQLLMTFYQASLQALGGDREQSSNLMREVFQQAPRNPYYLWFIAKRP